MQLLSVWKESLLLFKPSNLKLFLLVTLKSLVDTYKVWFRYWWWLIGLVAVGPYLISAILNCLAPVQGRWVVAYETFSFVKQGILSVNVLQWMSDTTYNYGVVGFPLITYGIPLLVTCLLSLLYVSLYLSARPSVAIKNWGYFKGYGKHALYIALWFLLLGAIPFFFGLIVSVISFTVIASMSLFFIIFLLDSDASPRAALYSLCRAAKMVVYNFPFCLISFVIIFLLYYLVEGVFLLGVLGVTHFVPGIEWHAGAQWIAGIMFNALDVIFMPIVACIFINYYIKKTHEQFTLYFGNH